eukprot:1067458-Ditylum_brightwellii.AAC.1
MDIGHWSNRASTTKMTRSLKVEGLPMMLQQNTLQEKESVDLLWVHWIFSAMHVNLAVTCHGCT